MFWVDTSAFLDSGRQKTKFQYPSHIDRNGMSHMFCYIAFSLQTGKKKNKIDFTMWHDNAKYLSQVNHIIMNLYEQNKKNLQRNVVNEISRENSINFKKSIFYSLDNVYKYSGIYPRNVIIIWWTFNDLIIKTMHFITISLQYWLKGIVVILWEIWLTVVHERFRRE